MIYPGGAVGVVKVMVRILGFGRRERVKVSQMYFQMAFMVNGPTYEGWDTFSVF